MPARVSLQGAGLSAQQLDSHVVGTKGLGYPGRISLEKVSSAVCLGARVTLLCSLKLPSSPCSTTPMLYLPHLREEGGLQG